MHSKLIFRSVAAIALTGLALAGCASDSAPEPSNDGGLDLVTLRHSWVPDQITLPYATAKAFGFYADEGIQLVDQPGNGGATAVQLVAAGEVMFGTGEASHLLNAQENGVEMVSVMQQYQTQPNAVITMKDSGITEWGQLRGKSIGGALTSSGHLATLASLKLSGIAPEEIDFVSYSPGAQFAALTSGQIDAAGTFIGNLAGFDFKDDVNILSAADAGYNAPSTVLFTTPEFIEKNPDLVERFVRATIKGLRAALEDPQAAAEAMAAMYANLDPVALQGTFEMDTQFLVNDWTDQNTLGLHNEDAWDLQVKILTELDQYKTNIDPKINYTNEFVEKIDLKDREYTRK